MKPTLRAEWDRLKHQWFPRQDTAEHAAYDRRTPGKIILLIICRICIFVPSRIYHVFLLIFCSYIVKNSNPLLLGLFKVEWEGDGFVGIAAKSYYCYNINDPTLDKYSSKGIKPTLKLSREHYLSVLRSKQPVQSTNRGFITKDHNVLTYALQKDGISYLYAKRKVLSDGISTTYLDI